MEAANPGTPMLRQYHELKQKFPGTILFFRCGDFYELLFDDAVTGAREMEIVLTSRGKDRGNPIPMCGIPHHAAVGYIAKLVRKGYRVAVCEQIEEGVGNKKTFRREVARIITPGTAIDEQLLETKDSVYLAAVCGAGEAFGAAFLDLSTGEFRATECRGKDSWKTLRADIESFAPREILYPESLTALIKDSFANSNNSATNDENSAIRNPQSAIGNVVPFPVKNEQTGFSATLTPLDDWLFFDDYCEGLLKTHFAVQSLDGYGLNEKTQAVRAAGAALRYVQETQRAAAAHIADLNYFEANEFMILDAVTLRNLEIAEPQSGSDKRRTLFGVIDQTVTNMGSRLLKSWLLRPSIRRGEIEARATAVEELCDSILRDRLRVSLKEISDLERLIGRLNMNTATPRDLLALSRSLNQVPNLKKSLSDASSSLLLVLHENIFELPEIKDLIKTAISENPPLNISDGGAIRDGFNTELDELRNLSRDAKQTIAQFEENEKRRSGIASLRVKFNNVFGYFIEISKSNLSRVPEDYERRQTLVNAERFTTPQLKEWERKILGAEERILEIETELFGQIRSTVAQETKNLQTTARALATLDALAALSETASRRNFVRPVLHDGDEIEIKDGRHPVVEAFLSEPFVPNDLYLNNSTDRLLIITGPNMGGKSTVLRQTAIIQILAQIGSFVPARQAKLPIVDRVWTRVGASDDLASGRSTFMVEMTETAAILHNATPRSLVLLDEIGRGTSTFDGLSIAWSVAEFLHDSSEHAAKTLFATHYHELTELAERLPGSQNYQITASERGGEVVFLHKLERGRATKSYGIAVARLAGLPPEVIARAREVLERLERYEIDVFADVVEQKQTPQSESNGLNSAVKRAARSRMAMQTTLFQTANETLIEELKQTKVENFSAEQLRDYLLELQKRIV
jgi:DNA mismatch repair protein MutS